MPLRLPLENFPHSNGENEMRFLAISFCAFALIPAASGAQQPAAPLAKGPTLQAAAVGFRVAETKVDASTKVTAAQVRRGQGKDVALMAAGVGLMIVGALVDNSDLSTILIIGGGGVAIYGLYNYLK
jgi:hypothetical protein